MTIDLIELSPSDAAAFATKEFLSIALEAQSRRCRLNPPAFGLPPLEPSHPVKVSALNRGNDENRATTKRLVEPVFASAAESSETRHESSKTKEDNSDQTPAPEPESKPVSKQPARKITAQPRTRGLGVPNKRARTVKAMEFGSDDE